MESDSPGILGAEMFKEFFERYDWYDSYKVEITQDMDDFVEEGFGVFRYHFEGNDGDVLNVKVDREAKGICGFKMTLDGKTLSAEVRPATHIGYIGLGSIDINLKIRNETGSNLPYSIEANPIRDIAVELTGELSGSLLTNEEVHLSGTMTIKSEATPLDKETNAFEKAKTQGEFALTLGEREIKLYSGLIPTETLTISTGPMYPCIAPGEETTIGIGLRNNTTEVVRGEIAFTLSTQTNLKDSVIEFQIEPGKATELPLKLATTVTDDNSVLPVQIKISVNQESVLVPLLEKTLNIPVIGASGAVVYAGLGKHFILETESIRIALQKTPSMALTYFEYKPLNECFTGWGLLPDIGYPFSGEGSEWYKTEFEVSMVSSENTAEIILTANSIEKPGLKYTIIHRVHRGLSLLDTIVKLENTGSEVISNLGVQTHGWFRFAPDQMHVPLRNKIVSLDAVDWDGNRQLPRGPKEYHENWISAQKQGDGLILGRIWDHEFIEEVSLTRSHNQPVFEFKLPDLKPGDAIQFTPCRTVMTDGSWETVRNIWARIKGTSESVRLDEQITPRSDLEFEIVPKTSDVQRSKISPIFVDASIENEMEFRLRVVHENPITAECTLQIPEGLLVNGKEELSFTIEEVSIDKPFHLPIKITTKGKKSWFLRGGKVVMKFKARTVRQTLEAVVYDSSLTPEVSKSVEDSSELLTTNVGDYSMAVSPQNVGGLVRYGKIGEPSMFFDTFPKVAPFIWWDKAYSGVTPFLSGFDVWDWESGLYKEQWAISEFKSGSWLGYEAKVTLQHSPDIKGLEATLRFLMLSGTPLVRLEIQLRNSSGLWKRPYLGFNCFPTPGGDAQSKIHSVRQGQKIVYEPTGNNADIWVQPEAGWGAYEGLTSGRILGIVSTIKARESLALDTLGEKAHRLIFRAQPMIRSGASAESVLYLFDAQSIKQVELLKNLPEKIDE